MLKSCTNPLCTLSVNDEDPIPHCPYAGDEWKDTPVHTSILLPTRVSRRSLIVRADSCVDVRVCEGEALRAELSGTAHHCGDTPDIRCEIQDEAIFLFATFPKGACEEARKSTLSLTVEIPGNIHCDILTVTGRNIIVEKTVAVKECLFLNGRNGIDAAGMAAKMHLESAYGGCRIAVTGQCQNTDLLVSCAEQIELTAPKTAKLNILELDVQDQDEPREYATVISGTFHSGIGECTYRRSE